MAGASLRLVIVVALVAVSSLGAHAISLKELPLHPENVCASTAVRAAFGSCAATGSTAGCCQGLDAIFANKTSPSYGCLCFPQVLYKASVKGAQAGLDILGLLSICRLKHKVAFQTQWAAADPTTCPPIPLSARAADMITMLGQEVILPGSRNRPLWAWGNLLQFGEVNQHLSDIRTVWEQLFGLHTVKLLLLVIMFTAPTFLVMHKAVLMRNPVYQQLNHGERLIVCQHSVYALVFGLSVVPQTILAFIAMFKSWTGDYFGSAHLTALCGLFLASRAMLYIVEASVRSVVKRSWLLIVHHQLFFLIIVMGVWTQNTAVLGIGIVLDLFACHEAPLYVSLLAYRLRWSLRFTRGILRVACFWYVVTRMFQTVVIMYMIIGFARMSAIRTTPEFIVTALLFGAFTVIQVYTLVIYHAIYRKVMAKSMHVTSHKTAGSPRKGGIRIVEVAPV